MMSGAAEAGSIGERVYQVRQALTPPGERRVFSGQAFAALLSERSGRKYPPSYPSKWETGALRLTLEDIDAIASVDPVRRGRLWLAWGILTENDRPRVPSPIDPGDVLYDMPGDVRAAIYRYLADLAEQHAPTSMLRTREYQLLDHPMLLAMASGERQLVTPGWIRSTVGELLAVWRRWDERDLETGTGAARARLAAEPAAPPFSTDPALIPPEVRRAPASAFRSTEQIAQDEAEAERRRGGTAG